MTQAYIIEIESRTAGIFARDDRGYRFFSSDRTFDGLEGRDSLRARRRAGRHNVTAAAPTPSGGPVVLINKPPPNNSL